MRRSQAWLLAGACALSACKKGDDAATAQPQPPSPECRAAAETLAGFSLDNYTPREERDRVVAPIEAECGTARLSDAEARCLADAKTKYATLRCPRVLTPDLVRLDQQIGTGRCRPVMLALQLAADKRMAETPPEEVADATEMMTVVGQALAKSCNEDAWPEEVFDCLDRRGVEDSLECLESVPVEIQRNIQEEIGRVAQAHARARHDRDGITPTGLAQCDAYLAARKQFDRCDAVPAATRNTLLAIVAPLEQPWRALPPGSLAGAPTLGPVCDQALAQLRTLASQVGCTL